MYQIQTLNKIAAVGLNRLDAAKFAVDSGEQPDGILVRSAALHDMDFPESLLGIARAGAGVNNIPLDRCTEAGIAVFNTPGANAGAVKELAIAALLLASRAIVDGINWCAGLTGDDVDKQVEKGKSQFVGPEIQGKTLGVIGLGAVGGLVANAAVGLGMNVLGADPYLSVNNALHLSRAVQVVDQATLLQQADYITIHSPLVDSTRNMVCAETIAQMKDGVRIVNLSRAGLVNDADILAALQSGKVARYVTDFPNSTLVRQPGVVAIPHLGASTPESEDNCAVMAADQLADYLLNGNIHNSVNLPDAWLARSGVVRLCVVHKNLPNKLSGILSLLAGDGVNVENMVNKSRGEVAYTIIDLGSEVTDEIVEHVRALDGIIRVRKL